MKKLRLINQNGQELNIADWNVVTGLASTSLDEALQELFRPQVSDGSSTFKHVIPFASAGNNNYSAAGIVSSTDAANGSVVVRPFRAIVGTRPVDPTSGTDEQVLLPVNSVLCVDVTSPPGSLGRVIPIAPTVSSNRCDLIYCKITLGATTDTDTRYIRDPDNGVITHATIILETTDTFDILVATGVEGATPAAPTVPTDSGNDYFIPLARVYVNNPFTSLSTVNGALIHEIAPVLPISRATGVQNVRPASSQFDPAGSLLTAVPFLSIAPPKTYIPPTMVGCESLMLAWDWASGNDAPPTGGTYVVDNSTDWRRRVFQWTAIAQTGGSAKFAWQGVTGVNVIPSHLVYSGHLGQSMLIGTGQSFWDDGTAGALGFAGGTVMVLSNGRISNVANNVFLFVDLATGELKLQTGASPGCQVFVWLQASGPFSNAA